MRLSEGGWKHTPARHSLRRRARWVDWQNNGQDGSEVTGMLAIAPGDTPEVAEDVHPKDTFTHDP